MRKNASGVYVIDGDFTVLSFNPATGQLYPKLRVGEKCYRCLAGRDAPCPVCPVTSGQEVQSPVGGSLETVDAVELQLPDGSVGYAIAFHSEERGQEEPNRLLSRENGNRLLGVINVLGEDYVNIYSVNILNQNVEIYRYRNTEAGVWEVLGSEHPYDTARRVYIQREVLPEDQEKLMDAMELSYVTKRLRKVPQFIVHYRVMRKGQVQYFYMKCARVGDAERFHTVVMAFAREDMETGYERLGTLTVPNGAAKRKVLVVQSNGPARLNLVNMLAESYEVLSAESAEEGLRLLSQQYRELSAVMLDFHVPDCGGLAFLERIREDVMLSSVPVLVMTGGRRLDDEVKCLELGAVDFIARPFSKNVVLARLSSVIKIRESAVALSAIEYDELTGLYTRQAFFHHAQTFMRFHPHESFHIAVADVKDFKMINSIYGEKTGDQVLKYLGKTYGDFMEGGLLSRYSSNQFVGILRDQGEIRREQAEEWAKRVADGAPVSNLSVKYGIYQNVDRSQPLTIICDRAFIAMKSIQNEYGQSIAFYDGEMSRKHIRQRTLEAGFEEALEQREFVIYYQPQYNTQTEHIAGAEALVRWKKPDGTLIRPGEFIPLFERNGQIAKLDEYVFRQVCAFQRQRMVQGKKLSPVSVNLSWASLHHEKTVEIFAGIVEEYGIPFSAVPIELTESAALYSAQIRGLTEKLVKSGFQLHMDDFGFGFSSMTSLSMLPFSMLKLDKSLVDYIDRPKGQQVVQYTIALAHGLGMKALAEGVERKEQVDMLRKMGCDGIQGFYYSKPQPGDSFQHLLEEDMPV